MAFKTKSVEERKKEIDDLTKSMSEQIESYFISEDKMKEHLAFMSNFHNYSLRNMALIDEQFKGARAVGSFKFWQSKGVSVKKGEKGIKILVPTPVEYFKRNEDWVQLKFANKQEKEQIKNGSIETQKKMFFKVGHVFEYTQTNAREKGMPVSEIFGQYHRDGVVENEKEMIAALHKISDKLGFEILKEPLVELGTAKGVAYPTLKQIALNPRNTDFENVTTLIHELAHARLHTPDVRNNFTVEEREFQAEMVSYVVANRYGIDTKDFSLSYLAGWTQGKELNDKENLLNDVRVTANEFIDVIDEHFKEIEKSKTNQIEYTNDPYQELLNIQENYGLTSNIVEVYNKEFQQNLKEISPQDYKDYLSYLAIYKHENEDVFINKLEVSEPLMLIHNQDIKFKNFGEVNNRDFSSIPSKEIEYTIAIPNGEKPQMVSGFFDKDKYAHPLHHLEKENIISEKDYELLESNYHKELLKEDSKTSVKAPELVGKEIVSDSMIPKKPQVVKVNEPEHER